MRVVEQAEQTRHRIHPTQKKTAQLLISCTSVNGSFSVICRVSVIKICQIENHSSAVAREMAARDW
jgi:hypothetical protein